MNFSSVYEADGSIRIYDKIVVKTKILKGEDQGIFTTNSQTLDHILGKYATNNVIGETDNCILRFMQQTNSTALQPPDECRIKKMNQVKSRAS